MKTPKTQAHTTDLRPDHQGDLTDKRPAWARRLYNILDFLSTAGLSRNH